MPLVAHFEANTRGRDFVVGDIHGWLEPFKAELEAVGFDPAVDRVFSVGDLIDRGPDSEQCLRLVREPWFHAVRGNHEQILFDWLADPRSIDVSAWMSYGGRAWLGSGPEHFFTLNPRVRRLGENLSHVMPWVIELELADGRRLAISHSSIPVDDWLDLKLRLHNDNGLREALIWDRPIKSADFARQVEGIDLTVHGHVILPQPTRRGNGVYLDTGAALIGQQAPTAGIPHPRISVIEVGDLFAIGDDRG